MNQKLMQRMENELTEILDSYVSTVIEQEPLDATPHFGDETTRLMACAAISVLSAVKEAQDFLMSEGYLDPDRI